MSPVQHLLVVADQPLASPELIEAVVRRDASCRVRGTVLVPAAPHERARIGPRLDRIIGHLRGAGVDAVGLVGDRLATVAVAEIWDPARYDELIIVSALAARVSLWLRIGVPQRIARLTGCTVHYVVASDGVTDATRGRQPHACLVSGSSSAE